MKVWTVQEIENWNGQVSTKLKLFKNKETALECMKVWKELHDGFIRDVEEAVKSEDSDFVIMEREDYFYCYDGINFDSYEIIIDNMEVL